MDRINPQAESLAEGESAEPPDDICEPPDVLPSEFKCPVLLFKPKFAGQSKVYSALDSNTKHRVAIKQLLIDRTSDSRKILSLIREIRFLRRLEHESIVNFLDVKLTPTAVYIEQELMDTDLECVFDNNPAGLGVSHCRLFSYQLVQAINFIHTSRIIHRDINPSNILVNPDTLFVKLGDFGSARILDNRFGKRCLSIPAYARYYHAPEVLAATGVYDLSSDMFSLGCVLYIMATGTIPIKNESGAPADLLKEWKAFSSKQKASPDAVFSNLIEKCLSTEPSDRPKASTLCNSSFFTVLSNGAIHQVPKSKFSVEEEVFDYDHIYEALELAVKDCKPDMELSKSGLVKNSSIRSFADWSDFSVATSTVSEHEARIAQTDFAFGIQIHDCSDKKDRMFYEDHAAESGLPFDPYKWDRKETPKPSSKSNYTISDCGYQSDPHAMSSIPSLIRFSESPEASSDHELTVVCESEGQQVAIPISERSLELEEEASRHHFDYYHNSHHNYHHHHHHHHHKSRKHKHHRKKSHAVIETAPVAEEK